MCFNISMILDPTIIYLRNNKFKFQILNNNSTTNLKNIGINLNQYITFLENTYLIK